MTQLEALEYAIELAREKNGFMAYTDVIEVLSKMIAKHYARRMIRKAFKGKKARK